MRLFDENQHISQLTFASSSGIGGNIDIVEALEDTRSETFGHPSRKRALNTWAGALFQSVYVTPRFL